MTTRADYHPAFLITIDTEPDNLWSKPRRFTAENAKFLPRFQALCERHGLKPTYLTDWEMAGCPFFVDFAWDAMRRGCAEVGMHLHAWNTPPVTPLTADDVIYQPFLIEHPPQVIREKVKVLTARLEETFGVKMISHRSGRWSFNADYARVLLENGYGVDCSVTPFVSWRGDAGGASQGAGTDFSRFPQAAYYLDLHDISREVDPLSGQTSLLEVPMTIVPVRPHVISRTASGLLGVVGKTGRRVARRLFPTVRWLRPNGRNGQTLPRMLDDVRGAGRDYAEFMLHSSEFMPGGSPTFRSAGSIERLYDDLERLFSHASKSFAGLTLADYAARFRAGGARMAAIAEVTGGSN